MNVDQSVCCDYELSVVGGGAASDVRDVSLSTPNKRPRGGAEAKNCSRGEEDSSVHLVLWRLDLGTDRLALSDISGREGL